MGVFSLCSDRKIRNVDHIFLKALTQGRSSEELRTFHYFAKVIVHSGHLFRSIMMRPDGNTILSHENKSPCHLILIKTEPT